MRYQGNPLEIVTQVLGSDIGRASQYLTGRSFEQLRSDINLAEQIGDFTGVPVRSATKYIKSGLKAASMVRQFARRSKSKTSSSSKRKKSKVSRKRSRSSAVIKTDSTSYGNKKIKSRKKSKRMSKSMLAKVASLEKAFKKLSPSTSYATTFYRLPYTVKSSAAASGSCVKQLEYYNVLTKTIWEAAIGNLTTVAVDKKTQIEGAHVAFCIRNNEDTELHIRCALYKCIDSTSDGVVDLINERIEDRGMTKGTPYAELAAVSGTRSYRGPGIFFSNSGIVTPTMELGGIGGYWRKVGKLYNVTIKPGDTIQMSWKIPSFVYKLEDYVDAIETYLKGLNYQLVYEAQGTVGHETGNLDNVQTAGWNGDGYVDYKITCSQVDNEGRHVMSYTSGWDNTNTTGVTVYSQPAVGNGAYP